MSSNKAQARSAALARRRVLTPAQQRATELALAAALSPKISQLGSAAPPAGSIAAYASTGSEPNTSSLLMSCTDVQVLLPVLLPDGDLDWALFEGELTPGAKGTLEPPGRRLGRDAIADCALVVVPALGVDHTGMRLGRGGGSYDRALLRARGFVVAALHPGELQDQLPTEPHDCPVHAVVLPERGLVYLPLPGAGPIER